MSELAKKPTCQCDDLYQAGNDYCQKADMFVSGSYMDGIYTEAVSGWEGACDFNKNSILVNASATYDSEEYAIVKDLEEGDVDLPIKE